MKDERVNANGEVCPKKDGSYNRDNRLSLQLFGNPVVVVADIKHVGVEACEKKLFKVVSYEKIEKTKVVGRCLICYSFIGENEYQGLLGGHATADEQASMLMKFVRTVTSVSIPLDETVFGVSSSWFCWSCGTACHQFLCEWGPSLLSHQEKQATKELLAKLIAAIQLSAVLARMQVSRNEDKDEDFSEHTNALLQMRAVDRVRELLTVERNRRRNYLEFPEAVAEVLDTSQMKVEDGFVQLDTLLDYTEEQIVRVPPPPGWHSKRAKALRKKMGRSKITPFSCMECGRGFKTVQRLKYHLTTHTAEPRLPCHLCDEKFTSKLTLTRHVRQAHKKTFNKRQNTKPKQQHIQAGMKTRQGLRNGIDMELPEDEPKEADTLFQTKDEQSLVGQLDICTEQQILPIPPNSEPKKARAPASHRKFACTECSKAFKIKSRLDFHLSTHRRERPFACDLCDDKFTCKTNLAKHLRQAHPTIANQKGETKPAGTSHLTVEKCSTKTQLVKEENVLTEEQIVSIPPSSKSKRGKKHGKTSWNNRYACDICRAVLYKERALRKHKETLHYDCLPACMECGERFTEKRDLVIHLRTHTGEKPFSCDLCNDRFISKRTLTRHVRQVHHKVTIKRIRIKCYCKICKKWLSSRPALRQHEQAVHLGLKPHSCPYCQKAFASKTDMLNHTRIHTRKFACSNCGRRFEEKQGLDQHLQRYKTGNCVQMQQMPLFQCNFCSKTIRGKMNLKRHVLRLHAHLPLRPFSCNVCTERFLLKKDLKHHTLLTHSKLPLTSKSQNDEESVVKVEDLKDETCSIDEENLAAECVAVATSVENSFALPEALWNTDDSFDPSQIC